MSDSSTPEIGTPDPIRRQQIRTFTKSTPQGNNFRQNIARDLIVTRRENREVTSQLQSVTSQVDQGSENVEIIKGSLHVTQQERDNILEEVQSNYLSLIQRAKLLFRPNKKRAYEENLKRLDSQFGDLIEDERDATHSWSTAEVELAQLKNELFHLVEKQRILKDPKAMLRTFYEEQDKALTTHEKLESGDVKTIAEMYGVFFAHAIREKGSINQWNLINNPTFEDALTVVLALVPSIATSTIRREEEFPPDDIKVDEWLQHLYKKREESSPGLAGAFGVLLKGGRITAAGNTDIVSGGTKLKTRTTTHRTGPLSDQIKEAIEQRVEQQYNELVVYEPEVAGIFVDVNAIGVMDFWPTIAQSSHKFRLPIYAVRGPYVYEANYHQNTNTFLLSRQVTPRDVLHSNYQLPEELRIETQKQALDHLDPRCLLQEVP